MLIDLSADCITIYDIDKDKPRADLVWNENEGIIEARSLKNGKKILASGEEALTSFEKGVSFGRWISSIKKMERPTFDLTTLAKIKSRLVKIESHSE